jgi:tetratricopeptide (TPR) repeat protein
MSAEVNPSPDLNPPPAAPPATPPAAPPGAAPKKPNRLVQIGGGCLGLIALGCILISGLAFYENWQQEQNYNAGHTAYAAGNCADAVEPLRKAASGDPGTAGNDVAAKAEAELQECEALLAAGALAAENNVGDAVLSYSDFVTKYPESPLKDAALTASQELAASSAPADLATIPVCQSLDALVEQQILTQPAERMPDLLLACGAAYEADNQFGEAVVVYERFLTDYPDHPDIDQVEANFARATIADAQASGAGELPPPQAIGASSEGGEQAVVVIQNDSPEPLSMVFSGPDVRVERLEACAECEKFSSPGPEACPEQGPVGRYLVTPGSYDVVVKTSSGRDVTPFRGTWELEAGQEYSSCFYVVTGS